MGITDMLLCKRQENIQLTVAWTAERHENTIAIPVISIDFDFSSMKTSENQWEAIEKSIRATQHLDYFILFQENGKWIKIWLWREKDERLGGDRLASIYMKLVN